MRRCRAALFGALALSLTLPGCVFAVGADDEGTEKLRDRVRDLEKRVDRLERPAMIVLSGDKGAPIRVIDGKAIEEVQVEPAPEKDPK